jgi:hypothetical protein
MASQTSEHSHPVARQGPGTHAVKPAPQAVPILADDIDPVLLVRLYPDEVNLAGAKTAALAAGNATMAAGAELELSRIEFDPAATGAQRKEAAVARAQAGVKAAAEHGTPQDKEAAAAELKRAQALPG